MPVNFFTERSLGTYFIPNTGKVCLKEPRETVCGVLYMPFYLPISLTQVQNVLYKSL